MKKIICNCLLVLLSPLAVTMAVSARGAAPAVFNVRDYGALGDGKADDSAGINKAIDACAAAGGGTVQVPSGTYNCVAIMLKSHITLQLDQGALLQGPSKVSDYPKYPGVKGSGWSGGFYGVVVAEDATDLAITGQGRIDGAGQDSWDIEHEKRAAQKAAGVVLKAGSAATDRPRLVQFKACQNIKVTGVTLSNSQMWTLVFNNCQNIQIDGLTIQAPPDSPETDGIDIRGSQHARITHCHIDNGDDNVAITGSRKVSAPGSSASEDVEVSDCAFFHGHGVSIGSITSNGVRNVRVHDCTFAGTTNGIRIKSMRGRGGIVEDIHYDNLKMTDVNPAITINAYYQRPPKQDTAQPMTDDTPIFKNIFITNLTAEGCPKSAGMIVGLPESLVSDVVLENVRITAATGLTITNASGIQFKNVNIKPAQGDPLITDNAKITGAQ